MILLVRRQSIRKMLADVYTTKKSFSTLLPQILGRAHPFQRTNSSFGRPLCFLRDGRSYCIVILYRDHTRPTLSRFLSFCCLSIFICLAHGRLVTPLACFCFACLGFSAVGTGGERIFVVQGKRSKCFGFSALYCAWFVRIHTRGILRFYRIFSYL